MENGKNTDGLSKEVKTKAAEIAVIAARLSEHEQEKVYYMLKGLELFNSNAVPATTRSAAV